MPITDILTHVEVAAPSSTLADSPSRTGSRSSRRADKRYRQALSRSLHEPESKGKPQTGETRPQVEAYSKPVSQRSQSRPTSAPESGIRPAEKAGPPTELETSTASTLEAESPVGIPADIVQPAVAPVPAGLLPEISLFTAQPLDEVVLAIDHVASEFGAGSHLEPPASFRLNLFETESLDANLPGSATADLGGRPLVPPTGLFAAIEAQLPDQAALQSSQSTQQPRAAVPELSTSVEVVGDGALPSAAAQAESAVIASTQLAPAPQRVEQAQSTSSAIQSETRKRSSATLEGVASAENSDSAPLTAPGSLQSPAPQTATRGTTAYSRISTAQVSAISSANSAQAVSNEQMPNLHSDDGLLTGEGPFVESGRETTAGRSQTMDGVVRATAPLTERAVELADKVEAAIRGAQQHRPLRVRLHPPELGTLQIEISSRNGTITARLEVETAAAHRVIMETLPLLQEALSQHGTVVDRIDVQLSPQPEQRQPEFGRSSDGESSRGSRREHEQERDGQQHGQQHPKRGHDGEPARSDELDVEI